MMLPSHLNISQPDKYCMLQILSQNTCLQDKHYMIQSPY